MTDTFEDRLQRDLRSRADLLLDAPLTLHDVKGAARTIRRRRRGAAAGAVAVLLVAVGVPLGVLAASGGDDRVVEPAPAVSVPDPGYLEGGTVRLLDGTEVPLAGVRAVRGWAAVGEGYVAGATRQGTEVVSLHDADGSLRTTWPVSPGASFVVDGDGRHAAWLLPGDEVVLLDGATGETTRLGRVTGGTELQPRGIVGECPEDCGVVVTENGEAGFGPTYLVPTEGPVEPYLPQIPLVTAVAPDDALVAGVDRPAPDDLHQCTAVWEPGAAGPLWEDCVENVHVFSPGGTRVATTFAEGAGARELRLRDARSGAVLHEIPIADALDGFVWEDEEHVLVAVLDDGEWSVVRIGTDGSETRVAGPAAPLPGDIAEVSSPYVLPTAP
ncbi:hypothetical protein AB0N29_12840 [Nocardioides sp. NPDC092400]|uniref:hypothetical protein n=1 Tax=Nocardioides sp. NPDC092400 TaxID=3155196 RepID=UPI003437A926